MGVAVHENVSEMIELWEGQRLGEEVCEVFVGPAVHNVNETGIDVLSDTKVSDVKVFGAGVDHRIVSRENRSLVVAHDGCGRLLREPSIAQQVSDPETFV